MMITVMAFVAAIALLVTFHEFGHYWVARRFGVKVLKFSLGFGKVLYTKRFSGSDTEWVISAIPLGGYVKMLDEREGPVLPEELIFSFNRKPVLQRMTIVAAGPAANFLLAILLYCAMFMYGVPGFKPKLGDVQPNTPASIAHMQAGEMIQSVNGEAVPSWQQLHWQLLDVVLKRNIATIVTQNPQGEVHDYSLDTTSLEASDLEGDFLSKLGLQPYQPIIMPVIGKLTNDGVAERAGLKVGDKIIQVNHSLIHVWADVVAIVRTHPNLTIQMEVQRGNETLNIPIVPIASQELGKRVGKIGAAPQVDDGQWQALYTTVRYSFLEAFRQSLLKTWQTSVINLKMMNKMVWGEISIKNISGPLTIADYAGQSAAVGAAAYLGFLALISISLGVMNLLPIPILDGGHLLYYAVELVKGGPVPEIAWDIGQKIGIGILGTLMVFAIFNDVNRLFLG